MSFSRDVKQQITQLPFEKPCCRQTHLLALTITAASEARTVGGAPHLVFTVDHAAVARHLFKLGKALYDVNPTVAAKGGTGPLTAPHAPLHYQVAIPVGESGMLPATMTMEALREALMKKACCRRSFLRGAFLGCGSVVVPTKAYHIEFNAAEPVVAWIGELLAKEEIPARAYHRSLHTPIWTLYLKDGEAIGRLLTLLGAHQAVLALEEVRVGKDLVNNVQRVVNCETANLNRTLDASEKMIKRLEWLGDHGVLAALSPDCRAVAQARLEAPYASLAELGERIPGGMSKSAVNHRLKLLTQAYDGHGGPPL